MVAGSAGGVGDVVAGVIGAVRETGFSKAAGAVPWCGVIGPAATGLF